MADNVYTVLCAVALKYVGAEGVEKVISILGQHLSDQGQRLTKALKESNERAWKALEVALAGETLWNKLDRAEDRAFRQQLAAYLKQLPMPELQGKQPYRKKILQDIFDARKKALLFGRLHPEEVARRAGLMANRSDPQAVLAAEKQALFDMAAELKQAKLDALAWLLEQEPQPGQSVLVVAVRYYFQRRVEEDEELARRLQFTAMENLSEAQHKGFQQLDEGLKSHALRVEQAMSDLIEIAEEIRDLAGGMRDATLDLRAEREKMRGENNELYAKVLQMLEQQQMHQRPVHSGDSLSMRSDVERQKVKEYLGHYRRLSEEAKRAAPALLNGLGKLQVATGDYQSAQEAFTRVAEISPDSQSRAEGHFNAYRAALERAATGEGSYQVALAELKMAMRFDAARFAPFPLEEYEPQRILGAGGFGVTFLCKKKLTGAEVAVKALQAEGLERDVNAVMQEASTLDQLAHPTIIRLRHCGYADAARTRPFIEMDFFESLTLEDYVRKNGRMSIGDLLAVARPLAEALNAAHGKGILHRDVKPANLLVRRAGPKWEVRVIDFGLALKQSLLESEVSSGRRSKSMTGSEIAGTRHYAAPEQMGELPGVRVGPKADIYGFAKTCCYALFQNTEPTLIDYKTIPEGLAVLLSQCLARTPNERPSGFGEVLKKLDDFARPRPAPTPKPTPAPTPPVPAAPRPKAIEVLPISHLPPAHEAIPSVLPVARRSHEVLPVARAAPRPPGPPPPPSLPPPPFQAPEAIRGPAIAMILVNLASMAVNLLILFSGMMEFSQHDPSDTDVITWVVFLCCTLANAFSLLASILMLMRKQFALSIVGCLLAMLPIGVCCIGGLPVGLWAMTTLLRPEVRSTFT